MEKPNLPEPWLRGTCSDVPPVQRAVLHALELAKEDLKRWCEDLSDEEVNARPSGLAPIAFHLRHIVRSADRLLTYAEGKTLTAEQVAQMRAELAPRAARADLFRELTEALELLGARVRSFPNATLSEPRFVGKQQLPTTVGGLLVHVADHTQRHVGQAITTAKIVRAG